MKGKVKWFNDTKGFGFIAPTEERGPDCFVHQSDIVMQGRRTLVEGQTVEFEPTKSPKGMAAKSVVPLD